MVVGRQQVQGQHITVGDIHNVKWGKDSYKASIAAVGKSAQCAQGQTVYM